MTKIAFNPISNWLFLDCPRNVLTMVQGGIPVIVDPADHDGRILFIFGTNDRKVSCAVNTLLNENDIFLDIGANHGSIGFAAANVVGPSGHVHLIEPQAKLCRELVTAKEAVNLANVSIHEFALSDRESEMVLARPARHTGMGTLAKSVLPAGWIAETVVVRNIRDVLPELVSDRPFGVKLDVEGSEPKILPEILATPTLKFVVFEGAQNPKVLFGMTQRAGLITYGLARSIFRPLLVRVESEGQMSAFHDFLAIVVRGAGILPKKTTPEQLRSLLNR